MLKLNSKEYIGEGEIRVCFKHPYKDKFCVKIPKPNTTRDYTLKELKYFYKLNKRNITYDYKFYSNFYKEIQTNLGNGQVFDLITDFGSNNVSKTLEYYLTKSELIPDSKLESALQDLKKMMIKFKVFTRDLRSRNICCRIINDRNDIELVLVDGIGHRDFIPLADFFSYFSKKKVDRTFKKWKFNSLGEQRELLSKKS
jgi:hypothetical protein